MKVIKSLLLVWKNKLNNLYYHIGTLNYDGQKYSFEYTYKSDSPRCVHEALRNGYSLHPAFPELKKTYESSKLFETFNRRIPDESRRGYEGILKEFELPLAADRMDLLKETRGALSGDPYTFEEPLRLNGNRLKTNFYINGMRHSEELPQNWPANIVKREALEAELEEDNDYNSYAVKILDKVGRHIGYVPGIYAQAVHSLIKQNIFVKLTVLQTRPNFAPQWWVRVEMQAIIEIGETDPAHRKNLENLIFKESA